jgi:hypothetical protein
MSTTTSKTNAIEPSRRALFGAGAALLAGGALSDPAFVKPLPWRNGPRPPDGADAELIRLCPEFDGLERQVKSYFPGGANYIRDDNERDVFIDQLWEQQKRLLDPLIEARATTLDGFRARAATLALFAQDMAEPDPDDDVPGQIVLALLRDLTGGVA